MSTGSSSNFYEVSAPEEFQTLLSADLERVSLINFWAPWAEPCKQMNEVVVELAKKYPQILVLQVEAETQEEIAESFEITAVPTFVILRGHTLLERISGADAVALTTAIDKYTRTPSVNPLSKTTLAPAKPSDGVLPDSGEETPEALERRLKGLMNKSKIVLFMKGTPDAPRCGFSRRTVALLREQKAEFTTYDILEDESARQGLKTLNNWPTFPQIIVNGEFVGGLDVFKEMVETGEFSELMTSA